MERLNYDAVAGGNILGGGGGKQGRVGSGFGLEKVDGETVAKL